MVCLLPVSKNCFILSNPVEKNGFRPSTFSTAPQLRLCKKNRVLPFNFFCTALLLLILPSYVDTYTAARVWAPPSDCCCAWAWLGIQLVVMQCLTAFFIVHQTPRNSGPSRVSFHNQLSLNLPSVHHHKCNRGYLSSKARLCRSWTLSWCRMMLTYSHWVDWGPKWLPWKEKLKINLMASVACCYAITCGGIPEWSAVKFFSSSCFLLFFCEQLSGFKIWQ